MRHHLVDFAASAMNNQIWFAQTPSRYIECRSVIFLVNFVVAKMGAEDMVEYRASGLARWCCYQGIPGTIWWRRIIVSAHIRRVTVRMPVSSM